MPLTPAEVHNVAFKKPPIGKRGYDEEEVDAFLDIVEVELSRLIEENNDLRARFGCGPARPGGRRTAPSRRAGQQCRARRGARGERPAAEPHRRARAGASTRARTAPSSRSCSSSSSSRRPSGQLGENRKQLEQAQARPDRGAEAAASLTEDAGGAPGAAATSTSRRCRCSRWPSRPPTSTWPSSKAEAERLVTEAQLDRRRDAGRRRTTTPAGSSARLRRAPSSSKEESTARAAQALQDAEQRAATITAQFEQRKAALERRVEELRTFEREYRTRLKSYLESQLRDLDASGKAESAELQRRVADAQQG